MFFFMEPSLEVVAVQWDIFESGTYHESDSKGQNNQPLRGGIWKHML